MVEIACRIALSYDILRWEERSLIKEAESRGVKLELIYLKEKPITINMKPMDDVVVLQRSISHYTAMASTIAFESCCARVINTSDALAKSMDKLWSLSILRRAGLPTPKTLVAFTQESAMKAAEELGYPIVVKPTNGSWGRLICLARDPEELRSIMEHRQYLPGSLAKVHLIQEFVKKPGRDIRVFVVGGEAVVAIYRVNGHWITNTARGAKAVPAKIDSELEELSLKTAEALGGEILGIDFFEDPERGYLVNEVNPIPEFKNTVRVTGYNLPGKIIDYVISVARR